MRNRTVPPMDIDTFCRSLRPGVRIVATVCLRDSDRFPPREALLPFDGLRIALTFCGPVGDVGPRTARALFAGEYTFAPLDRCFPWITSGDLIFDDTR